MDGLLGVDFLVGKDPRRVFSGGREFPGICLWEETSRVPKGEGRLRELGPKGMDTILGQELYGRLGKNQLWR